ncbi:hypothetical protein RXV86_13505 [Alisedimentitalea sp. MJ-SS2]|uniref:hypothetical protein n=1 Tax=Aliisedimentitalea sp. MJ-SS2 TaxID=3049795 RepID=UPI0029148EC6|nr:hypothetical protein [Alisedimentitalea sp. MJ-SS2]MDU8928402.1 hypothetical protein [Alisedimentitalea sp. MJ-SS2]
MRSFFHFDQENNLLRVKHAGMTESHICIRVARQLRTLPSFDPAAHVLVDMREAEDATFRSSDWLSFGLLLEAEKKDLENSIRYAILIAPDSECALAEARTYEGYVGSVSNMQVEIFDDAERAAEWLLSGKPKAVLADDLEWTEISVVA